MSSHEEGIHITRQIDQCAVELFSVFLFAPLAFLGLDPALILGPREASAPSVAMDRDGTLMVVIDLSIYFGAALQDRDAETQKWSRIAKDLFLHTSDQQAWLQLEQQQAAELTSGELVIKSIRVSMPPHSTEAYGQWESRPGNIWLLRVEYRSDLQTVVTGIDVLFGTAAVDLWPGWSLVHSPLVLDAPPEVPIAKITVRHGRPRASPVAPDTPLRANHDGKFKIVQISDTHMVTGPGVCKDASDAEGRPLTDSEADPLTVDFLENVLEAERPDLVILTGDPLHHDILDSQSTLFKVVSPMMDRSIRFAVVFGNHDDEGAHALSRKRDLSYSARPWPRLMKTQSLALLLYKEPPSSRRSSSHFVMEEMHTIQIE